MLPDHFEEEKQLPMSQQDNEEDLVSEPENKYEEQSHHRIPEPGETLQQQEEQCQKDLQDMKNEIKSMKSSQMNGS